jgi:hypothetical protein
VNRLHYSAKAPGTETIGHRSTIAMYLVRRKVKNRRGHWGLK